MKNLIRRPWVSVTAFSLTSDPVPLPNWSRAQPPMDSPSSRRKMASQVTSFLTGIATAQRKIGRAVPGQSVLRAWLVRSRLRNSYRWSSLVQGHGQETTAMKCRATLARSAAPARSHALLRRPPGSRDRHVLGERQTAAAWVGVVRAVCVGKRHWPSFRLRPRIHGFRTAGRFG